MTAFAATSSASRSTSSKDDMPTPVSETAAHVPDDAGSHAPKKVNRQSTFFELQKNSQKQIPQVQLTLQDLIYAPITSTVTATATTTTAAAANKAKASSKPNPKNKGTKERTVVLNKINTSIKPFELTAWMGPSGSGKTSLTSVVAGLVDPSDVTDGTILVNGEKGRLPKQMVGVVWQDDLLLSNLTVEETIYFAARLKTPFDTSDEEVRVLVRETLNELGLFQVRDHLIGSSTSSPQRTGISGGERKRTAVAAELVVRPSLLLLDEPTSGLDATTARSLMTTLKDLTSLGHSIAVVIHQPRTDIFKMIDHLLLLSKGRVVYNGTASCVRQHLEMVPGVEQLPTETGIADWIMDVVIADEGKKEHAVLANHWASCSDSTKETAFICDASDTNNPKKENKSGTATSQVLEQRMSTLAELQETPRKYEASFWKQLSLLTSRTLKQRRGERLTRVSILLTFSYTVFTALFWWQVCEGN